MSAINLPKISIVMPVLNSADTIEKAIQSVIKQNYPHLEFIIMDGGSTDQTVEIIKHYQSHIAYWQSVKDDNPVVAINQGIMKARGDLIAVFMADDWYEPDTFLKIASAYTLYPNVDMITCGGRVVFYDENSKSYKTKISFTCAQTLKLSFYNICFAASAICCRFVTKKLYERIGLYHALDSKGQYRFSNDKEFLLRAVLNQVKDIFIPHCGLNYFAHAGSSTFSGSKKNAMRLCEEHLEIVEDYLQKTLLRKQRWLLIYWYYDQLSRLFFYKLITLDFKQAILMIKDGLKNHHFLWVLGLIFTASKICIQKSWRLVNPNK